MRRLAVMRRVHALPFFLSLPIFFQLESLPKYGPRKQKKLMGLRVIKHSQKEERFGIIRTRGEGEEEGVVFGVDPLIDCR